MCGQNGFGEDTEFADADWWQSKEQHSTISICEKCTQKALMRAQKENAFEKKKTIGNAHSML